MLIEHASAFFRLLGTQRRGPQLRLLAYMILGSVADSFSILLLMPLINRLGNGPLHPAHPGGMLQQRILAENPLHLLALFAGLQLLRAGLQFGREVLASQLQQDLVEQLRTRCFQALLRAEWNWLIQKNQAEHANLLITDINRVGVSANYFYNISSGSILVGAFLAAAFWVNPVLTLIVGAIGGLLALLNGRIRRHALHLGSSLSGASTALHKAVQESLAGMKMTKILGNEARHLAVFSRATAEQRRQVLEYQRRSSANRVLLQLSGTACLLALLFFGLFTRGMPVAELATMAVLLLRLMPAGIGLQQQFQQWLHGLPAALAVERLLAISRTVAEPVPAGQAPVPLEDSIELTAVRFSYEGRTHAAVDGISLRIPARTTTAIIGESGAGKSTLADLLMGLLAPTSGQIWIDGIPLAPERRIQWRRSVAYVPQEVFLFNDTIRNNLLWARPQAQDAELQEALHLAAADFVSALPLGLETLVGDRGIRLSGGERQRIALARALLTRPSLILLDEATSALDVDNEARIHASLERIHGKLTIIAIGHRLGITRQADQVITLKAGRLQWPSPLRPERLEG